MAKSYLTSFIICTVLLLANLLLVQHFQLYSLEWVLYAHLVFLILFILIITIFTLMIKYQIVYAGYAFIGLSLVKIITVLIILYIFNANNGKQTLFVLNFVIIYLIYLFLSIYLGLRSLNYFSNK